MPRIGKTLSVALFLLSLAGCRSREAVTFTNWASSSPRSAVDSSGASLKLISAGNAVVQHAKATAKPDSKGRLAAPITARTTFFPKQKAAARKVIGHSRSAALMAAKGVLIFSYRPTGLDMPPEYLSGLRLIGASLLWDIEDAMAAHDYEKAISACGSATTLGYALMSGGAYEASLGASIINQSRQKMVQVLGMLNGIQLGKLGSAIQKASANRTPLQIPIENERDNMLLALQQTQDAFEKNKLTGLQDRIGSSAKDTIEYLQSMEKDQEKGKVLFDWIGNDITARTNWYLKFVKNPRSAGLPPKKDESKAKLMVYRYFGSSIENLVPMLQMTVCRTELFVLECYLKQKLKMQKPLPKSLAAFSKSATLDPFTGEPFYYKAGASSYVLYSAGEDGIDNGGITDSNFRHPDLLLEKAHT